MSSISAPVATGKVLNDVRILILSSSSTRTLPTSYLLRKQSSAPSPILRNAVHKYNLSQVKTRSKTFNGQYSNRYYYPTHLYPPITSDVSQSKFISTKTSKSLQSSTTSITIPRDIPTSSLVISSIPVPQKTQIPIKSVQPKVKHNEPIPFNCSETTANIKLRPIAAIDIRIKKRVWWEVPTEFLDEIDDFDVVLYDRRKRFLKVLGTVSVELAVRGLFGLDIYFALRLHLLPHLGRYVVVYGRCGTNCTYCGFRRIKFLNIEIKKKRNVAYVPMHSRYPKRLTLPTSYLHP